MKKMLLIIVALVLSLSQVFAQTEVMEVPWQDEQGELLINSLVDKIVADRDADGNQLHIYKLQMGGTYVVNTPLETTKPLTIMADEYDRINGTVAPPTIYVETDVNSGAATITDGIFLAGADITLKNIYVAGEGTGQVPLGGANVIRQTTNDINILLDGVIMDYPGFSAVFNNGDFSGMTFKAYNSELRNATFIYDKWPAFWVFSTQPVDTILFKNCTAMNVQGLAIQMRVPVNYLEIDHCTFANMGKELLFNESLTNAKITNNIFYNTFIAGGTPDEDADKDHDGLWWSTINTDTLYGNGVGDTLTSIMPESDRQIIVKNNVFFIEKEITDLWTKYELSGTMFMNERTQAMFDNDAVWPNLDESDNVVEDPKFLSIKGANDEAIKYVESLRGEGTLIYWGWEPDGDRVTVDWPLPENLKHSLSVKGTDGQELGDLNWFGITDVKKSNNSIIPSNYSLDQNYPNPFNPTTNIKFSVPEASNVQLKVFNALGQEVATLVNQYQSAGNYEVNFDASNLSSGLYIYQIKADNFISSKKMMLLK